MGSQPIYVCRLGLKLQLSQNFEEIHKHKQQYRASRMHGIYIIYIYKGHASSYYREDGVTDATPDVIEMFGLR